MYIIMQCAEYVDPQTGLDEVVFNLIERFFTMHHITSYYIIFSFYIPLKTFAYCVFFMH